MNIEAKLKQWVEAGLIDHAIAARISGFEASRSRPMALIALSVLGAGTIALGIVSVVAANWDVIPKPLKLGADLALGALLAFAAYAAIEAGRALATEVAVTLLYGFTLASLALVGQIYQLGTPAYQALLAWSFSTAPLLLLARSRYVASLWLAGLATTHWLSLDALFTFLTRTLGISGQRWIDLAVTCAFASPLLYLGISRVPWLRRERRETARAFGEFAWSAILAGGFAVQFFWYDRLAAHDTLGWSLVSTALLAGGAALGVLRLAPDLALPARRALAAALGTAWLSLVLATSYARPAASFVGATLQVAWLALFAWAALSLGRVRTFNLLTALIGLRVLVIYFEVFGSLLSTGMGLVTGGALTLLVAWLWRRKTRDLSERMREGAGHAA
jgi:uncharacterized membrane protein